MAPTLQKKERTDLLGRLKDHSVLIYYSLNKILYMEKKILLCGVKIQTGNNNTNDQPAACPLHLHPLDPDMMSG